MDELQRRTTYNGENMVNPREVIATSNIGIVIVKETHPDRFFSAYDTVEYYMIESGNEYEISSAYAEQLCEEFKANKEISYENE